MKILLIAGHGGIDPGAVGNGYKEADLTREFVCLLKDRLLQYADVDIQDTSKDSYSYLKSGGSIPFQNYDYMLEIHFNAGNGCGTEIYVHETENGISVEQRMINAAALQGFKNRGVKRAGNLLVMNTCKKKYGISCALLEVCFITSASDMNNYAHKKQALAEGIARAIKEGFGLSEKQIPVVLKEAGEITWELNHTYFPITEYDAFIAVLDEAKKNNSPLYWGYYKLVNRIK